MVRRITKAATLLMVIAVSTAAFAQWSFEWYVDPDVGSSGTFVDDLGVDVAADSGNYVYLIHDAGNDGIDVFSGGTFDGWDGSLTDDDTIVQLWGGGWARGEVGSDDLLLNDQLDGEVHLTSILDETVYTGTIWAIGFNGPVSVAGVQSFSGMAWYGISGGSTTLNQPIDSWNIDTLQTTNTMIPEPTTVALMVLGMAGVVAYRRKRSAE